MAAEDRPEFVEVPYWQLSQETLDRLLGEVALRDDTDYGDKPLSLEERVARARHALVRGDLLIAFDPASETASVLPREQVRRGSK